MIKRRLIALSLLFSSQVFALGGDIQLTDQNGEEFRLSDHGDKVVVLFFGYTHCPDVCPDTLLTIGTALELLQQPENVQVVFVSVDPGRDSLESLRSYLAYFDQRYIGVTGSWQQLKQVAKIWNARFSTPEQPKTSDYLVDHTTNIYVIERGGKVHGLVPYGVPGDHLAKVLRGALAQQQVIKAPAAGLVNLAGEAVDVFAQKSKATVLHFWATWCVPCREEFADLEAARTSVEKLPLDFYAISLGDKPEGIRRFLQDYPLGYTVLSDRTGYSGDHWQVNSLPMTLVLGPDGQELARWIGVQAWGDTQFIEQLRELVQ